MNGLRELRGKEEPNLHVKDLRFWTQLVPIHLVSKLNPINIPKHTQGYHKTLSFPPLCISQLLCTSRQNLKVL